MSKVWASGVFVQELIPKIFWCSFNTCIYKLGGYQTGYSYSLLMRANKLETATVQGSLACLSHHFRALSNSLLFIP